MVKSNNNNSSLIIAIVLFIGILIIFSSVMIKNVVKTFLNFNKTDSTLNILSSYENADLEDDIKKFASKNNIKVAFTYMGDLEIVDELNDNLILATRNLNNVILLEANEINTLDVVSADKLIITETALKNIEEALK